MDIDAFGQRYERYLRVMAQVARLPERQAYPLAIWLARQGLSPIIHEAPVFHQALRESGLDFPESNWPTHWRQRLADHAVFAVNLFQHFRWNRDWLARQVDIDVESLKSLVAEHGGLLFLTYHHAFHQSLGAVVGMASECPTYGMAAPEESSAIFANIGRYIQHLHRGVASHFNGGRYFFFGSETIGARLAHKALTQGGILISLNDFSGDPSKAAYASLFNRRIAAPMGTVKIACRLQKPIVAGLMLRDGLRYRLSMRVLDHRGLPETVMQAYFDFLAESIAEYPTLWDGWNWFSSLPLISAHTDHE